MWRWKSLKCVWTHSLARLLARSVETMILWMWCWCRCRVNICLVFHLNKWPGFWWNTHANAPTPTKQHWERKTPKHFSIPKDCLLFVVRTMCPTKCVFRMKFDREIKSTLKCVCKTNTATSESYKTKEHAHTVTCIDICISHQQIHRLDWNESRKRRRRSRRFVAVVFMVWHLLIICMRSI